MPAVTPLERFRRIPTPILALGDAAAVAMTGGLLIAWRALAWVTVRARDRDR